jgi:hypothetical protein
VGFIAVSLDTWRITFEMWCSGAPLFGCSYSPDEHPADACVRITPDSHALRRAQIQHVSYFVSIVTGGASCAIVIQHVASKVLSIAYVTHGFETVAWSYAVLDELPLGAHLTSPRRGYLHHGVYAGNGRVIHYGGFNRMFVSSPVEEVSLEEFTLGHSLSVKPWVAPKFLGQEVVDRARSRIGENRYHLFSNNCEHFAEWCIGGKSRSQQVDVWKERAMRGLSRLGRLGSVNSGSNALPA